MTDEINYCVVDIETSIKNRGDDKIGNNKASPFYPDNKAVWIGYKPEGGTSSWYSAGTDSKNQKLGAWIFDNHKLLVGHNIKFDLHYLRKTYPDEYYNWVIEGGMVWDTQIVEYLLSGQTKQYATLDSLSEQYGGTLKDDRIKEYWEQGIDTEDIPMDEIIPYLEGDVENTELIFLAQQERVMGLDMMPLILVHMEALLALEEMEHNGMEFNVVGAAVQGMEIADALAKTEADVVDYMSSYLPDNLTFKEVTPHSPAQLSLVLFGGEATQIYDKAVVDDSGLPVRYKTGKRAGLIKTKKDKRKVIVPGHGFKSPEPKGKGGYYPTDDESLKKLIGIVPSVDLFIGMILTCRELKKDLSTYFDGYRMLTFPDGKIHPNYNQCATHTGRLSCTSPNLQNATSK